jgi:pimeloyl-ACP methyl ester carboxylesterase
VLLVMGLGMQLIAWPAEFVEALADAGYRVIRFDNRDIGLSDHLDHLGTPNVLWESLKLRMGLPVRAPYAARHGRRWHRRAGRAGHSQAHVVGASMGGMVAQRMALAAPQRVRSLTSIMSSSGARRLPGPTPKVQRALLGRPRTAARRRSSTCRAPVPVDRQPRLSHARTRELRQRVQAAMRRSYHPAGSVRQLVAIAADATRAQELSQSRADAGAARRGRSAGAAGLRRGHGQAHPGARLVTVPGMGHDLPPGVVERLLPHCCAPAARLAP